jgi:orotate phosphoribosyltransferase
MKTLLRMSLAAAAVLCLLSAGAQTPAGDAVSDFDYAVDVVERAYAGYPDKTAGREAEYAALKGRLQSEISGDRDVYDAIAEYLGWFDDSHLQTPGAEAYRAKSLRRDTDYAGRMKRYDPQFMHCRVDEDTYLIRFPSCDLTDAEIAGVRAAVAAYRASGCENLVVDIRGNMGGSDNAYEPLLKLLYDHEGTEDAMEYRVSDIAIAHVREFAGNTERGRRKVARMERTPAGEFLEEGKTYRIRYDSVSPVPRRAALIVDGRVASSGEQLVLEVRASSRRTTVYGQDNTLGCLDYSNCEILYFPRDTARWMIVPVTRSKRIPAGRGIDREGIAPDVRIPLPLPRTLTDNVDPWVEWVAGDLKKTEKKCKIIMEKSIAKDLLSIGAVFLRPEQPFTWASGIKSPIYCDNRLTLTAPVVRGHVEAGLAGIVRTKFPGAEVLMGTSTAGIAHAAITATILDLPMGYVRSGSKDHGRGNRIEGKLEKGQKVVVIEDLISTGGSCIEVVNALREAGAEVLGVASIFTYGMKKGLERLKEADVVNYSLSNLDALVEVAAEEGYIEPGDKARLLKFRDNPSDESWMDK